jgi:hypothetical protein
MGMWDIPQHIFCGDVLERIWIPDYKYHYLAKVRPDSHMGRSSFQFFFRIYHLGQEES